MIIYLDTNAILDFLLGRKHYGGEIGQIVTFARKRRILMVTEAGNLVLGFYYSIKQHRELSAKDIKHNLAMLRKEIDCVSFDAADLDAAIALDVPDDLEDGVQVVLADKAGADYLITNDRKLIKIGRFNNTTIVSSAWFLKNEVATNS